jgi:cytochrome P450
MSLKCKAGGETVGSTLSWLLMYLALYPDVQTKCQQEIDRVIGERNVTLDDKPVLPFVEV